MNRPGAGSWLALWLLCGSNGLAAAPTGADLLTACRLATGDNPDAVTEQMCSWYVTPCDCHIDPAIPRVCLPAGIDTMQLAGEVIAGLETRPDLLEQYAGTAAATILAASYPCMGEDVSAD